MRLLLGGERFLPFGGEGPMGLVALDVEGLSKTIGSKEVDGP